MELSYISQKQKKMKKEFKLGDKVKVIDRGECYHSYDTMADKMGLKNWRYGNELTNGDEGIIVAIEKHPRNSDTLCGVDVNGREYIMSVDGLELVELPEHWYIEATCENYEELKAWWEKKNKSVFRGFSIGHYLMSYHPDGSYYFNQIECYLNERYPEYQKITLEQFRKITQTTPNMDTNKTIKIDRTTLNEYYDAATYEQKKFLNDNFKLDGTTTVKAVKQLHDIACEKWKRIIKKNHPECFEDDKHFTREELQEMWGNDIEVRTDGEYKNKGFYLCDGYNWELKVDSKGVKVLIPTKK